MPRPLRTAMAVSVAFAVIAAMPTVPPTARAQEGLQTVTVKARLIGWIARRDGYFLYREGTTLRMVVVVWPDLRGEQVRARLEWRRAGQGWRLLDVTSDTLSRDSRALFLVRGLPDGFAFRIRSRVPRSQEHRPGRSSWRYFRVI